MKELRGRIARFGARGGVVMCTLLAVVACTPSATPGVTALTPTAGLTTAAPPMPTPTVTLPPTPTPTPAPVTPTILSVPVSDSAPDGSWSLTFTKPQVSGVPTAAAMNSTIDARVNAMIADFMSFVGPVSPGDGPGRFKGGYTVGFVSPTIVSLRFTADMYFTGAATTDAELSSVSFDVSTGAVINLASLFTSTAAAVPVLSSECQTRLTADPTVDGSLDWPASPTMATFEQGWVFTAAGLGLAWDKYEVAPGAAGLPSITIPWSALAGIISPTGPAAQFLP